MKEFNYNEFEKECLFEEYRRGLEIAFRMTHIKTGEKVTIPFNIYSGYRQSRFDAYKSLFDKVYGEEK